MSNTDFDFDPRHIPDPAQVIGRAQNSALGSIATVGDGTPDDAARSIDIANVTGVPASVVAGDLEHHEQQLKTNLSADLIKNNPYLLDYINSHPLAAQLSSDDLGNLDTASQALEKIGYADVPGVGLVPTSSPILAAAFKGFKENFDAEGLAADYDKLGEYLRESPLTQNVFIRQAVQAGGLALEGTMRGFGGAIGGIAAATGETYKQLGGNEAEAARLTRDLIVMANVAMSGQAGLHGIVHPELHAEIKQFHDAVKPYLDAGVEPPVGVHPKIDEMKIETSAAEVDQLMDAIQASQKSSTKELNPDIYANNFVKQHVGDQSIGIHADVIRELYKDKFPEVDDDILGFIAGLDEKLITAEATGGYVDIPMADYIAKVDPQVAKALEDFTRVRAAGVSKGEAKDIKASVQEETLPPAKPEETVRDAARLDPKERKLQLKRVEEAPFTTWSSVPGGAERGGGHHFEIQDTEGKPVGNVFVGVENGGKRLYIDDIEGLNRSTAANSIGPRALRDLLQQLKAEFPQAEELTGYRVSGARDKAGSWETKGKVSIKLAEPTASDHLFQILLDDRIERLGEEVPVGEGFTATSIPEDRWQNFERGIVKQIDEELARLGIADVDVEAAHKITNVKGELVRGLYQSYENARPTILFALTADDPVGVLRHEVMHDLRTRGFLNEQEWGVLEKAAIDGDWLGQHATRERYEGLNEEGLIEEAIADHFADWRRGGKPADSIYAKVFQKIDEFIEKIRAFLRQTFGHENWKDIFDKIEKGEVAAREPRNEFGDVTKEARDKDKLTFTTAKGSTYQVHGDNTTTRNKSFHPEHGEKDQGPQPKSEATFYVSSEDVLKLAEFQAQGGGKKAIAQTSDGRWGVKYLDGKDAGKFERRTVITPQMEPAKGLTPVEIWKGGERVHFGNEITEVNKIEAPTTKATQPELPGTRRMEDRDVFAEAAAAGMTKDQYLRYMKLIAERHREDLAKESERALKDAKRRQTQEWKDNSAAIREQVVEQINARPDVAADMLLREQRLFGRKTDPVKIGAEYLSPEERAALPKDFVAKTGENPDNIAGLVGYDSGTDLINGLAGLEAQRKASGLRPIEFTRRLIAAETERQMEAKYGNLAANILEEAKEQVLSETQLDLLHEEVLAAGLKAGTEFPITKDQMKSWVKERFDLMEGKDVSSDKLLADAGRAGRMGEDALLKDDPAEAFRQKQRQYIAVGMARLAKDYETQEAKFDKTVKRYTSKEVSGASQEYTNAIHAMMVSLGLPVRRSIQGIAEDMLKAGHANFSEFVQSKTAGLRDLHVPDWVYSGTKKYADLTVEEQQGLFKAMEALTFNARDELKLIKSGEKFELSKILDQMGEQIKSLGEARDYPVDRKESKIEYVKAWWWSGINVESMLNRLDRDRSGGIFNQFIIRHFTEASNYKDKLIRDFQGKVSEIGKIADMDKVVDNPLFVDPITGNKLKLRRRNILGILQNVGNADNLKILAEGYKVDPKQLMNWLVQNTTKEDWDRAQRIGDIFKEIHKLADNMSYNVSGVGIDSIPLQPMDTPFGSYAGWYNPIKHDPLRPGESKKLLGPNALEQEGFFRATTPQGYTKGRTGYIAPVQLDLDIVPIRMRQMLHDIAMRPAVLQLSKIFYDPGFNRDMIGYFGKHQAKEMIPFLHDIANSANFKSLSASYGDQALEYFRQNTIATLIGFNPGTVMKHGATAAVNSLTEVGIVNFAREFVSLTSDTPEGNSNWRMAMDKSEELQRRMRNYGELIEGHGSEINIRGARSKFASYRDWLINIGATPVSVSDLLSAVPTWLAQYKTGLAKNLDEGQAVFEADRAVRHAHGSSVLSNKPSIARTNALGSYFSSLYGFFSHMQQKQYELSWKAKDLLKDTLGKGSGDEEAATRHAPDLLKGLISYVIFPAIIEEMVTPYTNADKDSYGVKAAKILALGLGSSLIGVRDFLNSLINVRDPQSGLASTTLKLAQDLPKDLLSKQPMTKERAGKLLHHTFTTTGILTGLTNNSEGNIAEYIYRYNHGLEHPNGEWLKLLSGLRHGKTK